MKIAVVDHVGNHGGGSRVVRALLPALKEIDPTLKLTYFGNPTSIWRENLVSEFLEFRIPVFELHSQKLAGRAATVSGNLKRIVDVIQSRWLSKQSWLPPLISGNIAQEIEQRIRGYDLVFYPWPFLLEFRGTGCPAVGIFHDFNYKYYFGGSFTFSPKQREQLEREMPVWLENVTPVVSSNFMASELASIYPVAAHKIKVVHLAPLGGVEPIENQLAEDIVRKLGVNTPYLLFPTHMCMHKNMGPLIAAVATLRAQGRLISLVLTGAGTEQIRGRAKAIGVRLDSACDEVMGLGYVSNLQMNALIQCAAVVVSPSLYEAGNGPGVDGWGRGVPVAMSNIPAFTEHLEVFGVRAQVFDPRSPQDIAEKIAVILDEPDKAREDALISKSRLAEMTWKITAARYLEIFRNAIQASSAQP